MGATTEDQNHTSKTGSNPKSNSTLYDEYQRYLSSQSQDKSGHRQKDRNQDGSASAEPPPPPADPNGDATQNNSGGGESLPLKKRKKKDYEAPPAVRGFEKDEMSLEMMLIQDGCPGSLITIGVVGQRGVGKTTLCRKILKNERVKGSYSKMFWITLSEVLGMEEIEFTDADGMLELATAADGIPTRLNNDNLNQQLKEGKYIIVFDDVGEAEEDEYYQKLKDCVDGLPNEEGGAVIVTCRSEKAAMKLVGDENLHRLQPLNNPASCWWIYNEAVRGEEIEEDRTVSEDVKEELMKRCGGLPWAARMMGKIKAQQLSDDKNKPNQTNNTPVS